MTTIIKASDKHIQDLCPLFDLYRVFYGQKSDVQLAEHFLKNRLANNEAIVFLAYVENKPAGFTLLYKTFSSVSVQPLYILNDLYVHKSYRKKGIGEALLNRAKELCIEEKHKGLALETDVDNPAQKLYEKLGWKKDSHCFHYFWTAQ